MLKIQNFGYAEGFFIGAFCNLMNYNNIYISYSTGNANVRRLFEIIPPRVMARAIWEPLDDTNCTVVHLYFV